MLNPQAITRLREIEKQSAPGLINKICHLFMRDFPASLLAMKSALHQQDFSLVSRKAHSLKSSCGHIGAMNLAQHCEELELAANDKNAAHIHRLLADLEQNFPAVNEELMEIVSSSSLPLAP